MRAARWYRWLVGEESARRLPAFLPWVILVAPFLVLPAVVAWTLIGAR